MPRRAEAFREIRILLVAPSLDKVGGQSIQANRLRERLARVSGVRVRLLPIDPRLPGPLRRLQRVKYVRTIATSIAYVWSLLRTVPHYDVVHAFSASYWSFLLAPVPAMLAAKLFGKRIVLDYRSGEADDHLSNWRMALWGVRLADVVVVHSAYHVGVFAKHGVVARSIYNFVDEDKLRYRERSSPRPRFFGNRHFEPLYNVPCLVRAFAIVQRAIPDAELILAGDGVQRAEIERLIRELDIRRVRLIGRVDPRDMPALYDWADVYLNSPNIDNVPGSLLECLGAGLPVASTDAGGIPFIVINGETGLLVPCGDHQALAAAAIRLVREPGLAHRLASNALAEARSKYVWSAVRDKWTALYGSLAPSTRDSLSEPVSTSGGSCAVP